MAPFAEQNARARSSPYTDVPVDGVARQIRILDLLPGRFDTTLKGTLRTEFLTQPLIPNYEALSYTWGASPKGHLTLLNGAHELQITDNLYNALQRLRRRRSTRALWADALCIGQNNDVDKVHQIKMMGDIYGSAKGVDLWLGESGPSSLRDISLEWQDEAVLDRFF